jgi:hypothetical protein
MDIQQRHARYKAIETLRQRPLIIYATSTRAGVPAQMAGDSVRQFIEQIDAIESGDVVDVLIHSTGGDALVAWKLMSLLRERFKTVGVLVPFAAFSAATLFSLGADEIVMHPHASLGPIDPQITIPQPDGNRRQFAFEDVGAFLRFLQKEVGLTEQAFVTSAIERLFAVVDPVHVGGAKRASELSTDVGERLLQMHMKGPEEKSQARAIAERLNKTFFAHGDAVSRTRARDLQLKVAKDNPELERLMWAAYLGLESYMECMTPFNPLHHYLAKGGAAALKAKAPLVLPPNAPAQLVQQAWQAAAQQALQEMQNPGLEVGYSLVNAVIESTRIADEFRTSGLLAAARAGGGEIQLSITDTESGWKRLALPAAVVASQTTT